MNPLRRLLVHVDGSPRSSQRLQLARELAQSCDAGVTAMLAVEPAWVAVPMAGMGDAGGAIMLQAADDERRQRARAHFDEQMATPGPGVTWCDAGPSPILTAFAQRALYNDLLVMGQHDPDDALAWGVPGDFVPSVAIASGRPTLVVPSAGEWTGIGRRVLVAWKPTREAARALTAALPMLQSAQAVDVALWSEPADDRDGSQSAARDVWLEDWLEAHGVQAQMLHQGSNGRGVGDLLLSLAADRGSDLLVMGCYGHARAREWLLGGVTQRVLRSMTLPVLLAH
jgi:nucleotide-binding universal stress UspA family protein